MNYYDDRARLVFHHAREEGSRLGHSMIGPEHLLLGLMREGGDAAKVLESFGASLEELRQTVEQLVGRGEGSRTGEPPAITPRARWVMEIAGKEALNMSSQVIGTEHILLGIIREGDGIAWRILANLAGDVDKVWDKAHAVASSNSKNILTAIPTPFVPIPSEFTGHLLPYPELSASLERVLRDKGAGTVQAPERLVMPLPGGGTLLLMPATDSEITVVKQVTVHPNQQPSVQAEVYVMDTQTGERKLALDGNVVTARRTAAVSLLAAQKLAPNPDGALLLVGAGTQAKSHLEAFQTGLGTKKVYITSRNPYHPATLQTYAHKLGLDAEIVTDSGAVLDEVSLIVTVTTSRRPVLPSKIRDDVFIAAVGAYRPDMAEIPAELVRRCRIYVDTLEGAKAEAGDLIQAGVDWGEVRSLEQTLDPPKPSFGPVLFKSVGHALWDLAAARLAVARLGNRAG